MSMLPPEIARLRCRGLHCRLSRKIGWRRHCEQSFLHRPVVRIREFSLERLYRQIEINDRARGRKLAQSLAYLFKSFANHDERVLRCERGILMFFVDNDAM